MARNCIPSLLAASMLLCTLAAANAQQAVQQPQQPQARENIGNQIPRSWGGLPEDTPARPQTVRPTPPVHDIPPPRASTPLSMDQQLRLQKEMSEARARNQKLEDPNAARKAQRAEAANAAAIETARKKAGKSAAKPAEKPASQ